MVDTTKAATRGRIDDRAARADPAAEAAIRRGNAEALFPRLAGAG